MKEEMGVDASSHFTGHFSARSVSRIIEQELAVMGTEDRLESELPQACSVVSGPSLAACCCGMPVLRCSIQIVPCLFYWVQGSAGAALFAP